MNREPLALKVLKLPYSAAVAIFRAYGSVAFAPFKICSKLASPFLYAQGFQDGDSKFYLKFGILRGILSLMLLCLWLASVFSPYFVIKALDDYIFKISEQHRNDSIIVTLIATVVLGSLLGAVNIYKSSSRQLTRDVMRFNLYFIQDISSIVLTIQVLLMYFNAKKVFLGDFNGPERRYLKFISYIYILSLLDWITFSARILIKVYPIRQYELRILEDKYDKNEFKLRMVALQEGLYTLREVLFILPQLPLYFLCRI